MRITLNPDKEHVELIKSKLEENRVKYGKRYCPCSISMDDDSVCMCKEFRDMESGMCHCGLYSK